MATILIVDDRPLNRQYLVTLLGYFGHRLLEASDGEEALRVARAEHPSLIISDMVMPKMDGHELAKQVARQPELAGVPVVFYTATYSLTQASVVAAAVGAFGVLRKPSEPKIILDLVNKALGSQAETEPYSEAAPAAALEKLRPEVSAFEAVSDRLAALIEMSLELVAERDPERLLEGAAHMARKLIPSRYAAVILFDENREPVRYCASGGENAGSGHIWPADAKALTKLIEERRGMRTLERPSLLCVPLQAPTRTLGQLCLLEKLGDSGFSDDEERVAETLASHAAAAYEKVAERKQAEEQMALLNRELKARVEELHLANKSLESFGYSVSHDLRAPLRAIESFAEILAQDHPSSLNSQTWQAVNVISTNCRKMGQLIDDLLEFSRVSRAELRRNDVDMNALVESVIDEQQGSEPGRRIEITVAPLPHAHGDSAMLRRVFTNLIANAWKFTRHAVPPRIEIGSCRDDQRRIYFVKDNGAGFDMEFAGKLFGVFKRLHTDQEFEGTGIGLALVSQIIHRHGGEVWAQAEVKKGATFYFTLECAEPEKPANQEIPKQPISVA